MNANRRLLISGLGVVAIALVVVVVAEHLALPDGFVGAVPALLTLGAALGYGALALRALGALDVLDGERWVWSMITGLGVVGTLMSLLATLQAFSRGPAIVVVIAGLAALAVHARSLARDTGVVMQARPSLWLAALTPFAAFVLVRACAPPSFYDALVYHLGLPMQYAARGGAFVDVHNHYSAMPVLAEMAASPALLLGGTFGPEAMGFVYAGEWAVLAVAVSTLVTRAVPDVKGADSAAAFVTAAMPVATFLAGGTKPDLLAALFSVVIMRSLARIALEPDGPSRAAFVRLGALCTGLGCACKTTFLMWAVVIGVFLVVIAVKKRGSVSVREAILAVILVVVAGAFPYVRNAVAVGNPVFPFGASIFGGPSWVAHTAALYANEAHRIRSLGDLVDVVRLPWTLSVDTDPNTNEAFGVVWLIGVVALLFTPVKSRALSLWAALAVSTLPMWLLTHQEPRYDPFLWLTAGVAGGVGLASVAALGRSGIAVVVAAALGSVVNGAFVLAADDVLLRGPAAFIVQHETRAQFLERAMEPMAAYAFLNKSADGGCVLLGTGDPRVAYLRVPAVPSEIYTRPALDQIVSDADSIGDVVNRIKATGATHVLLAKNTQALWKKRGWGAFDPAAQARFDDLASVLGEPIYQDKVESVFALTQPVPGPCRLLP